MKPNENYGIQKLLDEQNLRNWGKYKQKWQLIEPCRYNWGVKKSQKFLNNLFILFPERWLVTRSKLTSSIIIWEKTKKKTCKSMQNFVNIIL